MAIFHLRKKAFKSFTPPHLYEHVKKFTDLGIYDTDILAKYSEAEINELNEYIDHWRDMKFSYAAVKQLEGKYLVQNRVTGEIYESPQLLYVLVGMCLFQEYEPKARMDIVKRFYDAVSNFKISLPTPIMAGVRTPTRQFSSCVLIEAADDLDSISAAAGAIVKYVSQRAGIGINAGRIRAIGSPIRGGEATHTGCIPFYKHFHTAVKSCSQGGVRGGAATLFYPLWHLEVRDLLVLKNNAGTDENRVRHLDYGVQFNGLMYQRFLVDGDITLFSPHDVPRACTNNMSKMTLSEKKPSRPENYLLSLCKSVPIQGVSIYKMLIIVIPMAPLMLSKPLFDNLICAWKSHYQLSHCILCKTKMVKWPCVRSQRLIWVR